MFQRVAINQAAGLFHLLLMSHNSANKVIHAEHGEVRYSGDEYV